MQRIMNELQHYLKIKQDCLKDYLNLWKARDNKDNYFNDFMLINKTKDNLWQLLNELPAVTIMQKPQDVSLTKLDNNELVSLRANETFKQKNVVVGRNNFYMFDKHGKNKNRTSQSGY